MRLDKFIADNTEYSRKDVKRLAKNKSVLLNDQICKDLSQAVREEDTVSVDGVTVELMKPLYLMLYKPKDTVCANTDAENPTVIDVIAEAAYNLGETWIINKPSMVDSLQIVGRLDKDTTGLLFITNDGQWNHRVASPNSHCTKTYIATLADTIDTEAIEKLEHGVFLKDDDKRTLPATVIKLTDNKITLEITEGRYHQAKRMLAAVGNRVIELHRQKIGAISLDQDLSPGEYRALTLDEISSFI